MTRRRITPRSTDGGFALALLTSVVLAATGAGSAGGGTDMKGPQRFAYRVAATYTLTRDAVDPTSGQHTLVDRRVEAEFRVWAKLNDDQAYTGTSGDYAEVDGKAVAAVRDDRTTPACSQTVEAKGRVGLKFVTSRAPLTAVYVTWSPGTATRLPTLPCGASEIEQWETGKRGVGDWSRVSGTSLWHESRTKFYGDVFAKLAAGQNATFELATVGPGQSTRASVRLVFTRAADLEPKPAPPSSRALVVTKPAIVVGRYNATVRFAVTRGGDRTGVGGSTCTGSFAGGPGLYGAPSTNVVNLPRLHPALLKLWPDLRASKGWVTFVECGYEHDEYTKACGKTFRGALRLVVDGNRAVTRQFSFPWKAKGYAC